MDRLIFSKDSTTLYFKAHFSNNALGFLSGLFSARLLTLT